jgi:hypothetical protein
VTAMRVEVKLSALWKVLLKDIQVRSSSGRLFHRWVNVRPRYLCGPFLRTILVKILQRLLSQSFLMNHCRCFNVYVRIWSTLICLISQHLA